MAESVGDISTIGLLLETVVTQGGNNLQGRFDVVGFHPLFRFVGMMEQAAHAIFQGLKVAAPATNHHAAAPQAPG